MPTRNYQSIGEVLPSEHGKLMMASALLNAMLDLGARAPAAS